MFKLLKFIDEYRAFQKGYSKFSLSKLKSGCSTLWKDRSKTPHEVFENLFLLISKFAATIYYMLDNSNLTI